MAPAALNIEDLPDLAMPREVAQVLRCSTSYVQSACKQGLINASLVAGRYLISPAAVRNYIKGQAVICPEETKAPTYTGEQTETAGTSAGEKMVGDARNQRALDAAQKLKKRLPATSLNQNPPDNVVQINGS